MADRPLLFPSSPEITAKNIEARIAIPWIRVAPGANCNTFDLTVRGIDQAEMDRVVEAVARELGLYCRKPSP